MSTVLVDTNVIIDFLDRDGEWADWSAAMFEPHIVAEVVALLGELTPEQGARLTQLVDAVDAAASRRMFDASEQTWAGVIAHFPGLAPALLLRQGPGPPG